ncbi:MAG: alkyl hydroperoxide reductase [Microbacterium sp. SCN 70-27]|nr:MAG: alkyl hydroperoxide reductase [Microbacterium sp. SCN 70-27]
MMRRILASVVAGALALTLAACSGGNDDLVKQYQSGTGKGYISGDGRVQEIPVDQRGGTVEFTGTAIDGSTITSADYAGKVLVLNFWYADCAPCRVEAPILERTFQQTKPDGAEFLGVNIYDGPERATSFEEKYGISYPSLLAVSDADLKLAFAEWTSVQATPTTLVVDRQGRVAARFVGQVQDDTSLPTIVADVLAEGS